MTVACVPSDAAVAGGGDSPADRGLDHLDDRHAVALASVAQHRAAGGVAGDDQQLHALADQLVHDVEGEGTDLGDRSRPVGAVRGVADVEHRFVRQLVQTARATVSPPTPLSKIPIGASFMA